MLASEACRAGSKVPISAADPRHQHCGRPQHPLRRKQKARSWARPPRQLGGLQWRDPPSPASKEGLRLCSSTPAPCTMLAEG